MCSPAGCDCRGAKGQTGNLLGKGTACKPAQMRAIVEGDEESGQISIPDLLAVCADSDEGTLSGHAVPGGA